MSINNNNKYNFYEKDEKDEKDEKPKYNFCDSDSEDEEDILYAELARLALSIIHHNDRITESTPHCTCGDCQIFNEEKNIKYGEHNCRCLSCVIFGFAHASSHSTMNGVLSEFLLMKIIAEKSKNGHNTNPFTFNIQSSDIESLARFNKCYKILLKSEQLATKINFTDFDNEVLKLLNIKIENRIKQYDILCAFIVKNHIKDIKDIPKSYL